MILGNQINRIEARRADLKGELKIKSNIEITDVSKKSLTVGEEAKNMLNFSYKFNVSYSESAFIVVEGIIYYSDTEEQMDKLVAKWKKDKKLGVDTILPILNHGMELGYTQAIGIASKMRLPSPMKMPKFIPKEAEKK